MEWSGKLNDFFLEKGHGKRFLFVRPKVLHIIEGVVSLQTALILSFQFFIKVFSFCLKFFFSLMTGIGIDWLREAGRNKSQQKPIVMERGGNGPSGEKNCR